MVRSISAVFERANTELRGGSNGPQLRDRSLTRAPLGWYRLRLCGSCSLFTTLTPIRERRGPQHPHPHEVAGRGGPRVSGPRHRPLRCEATRPRRASGRLGVPLAEAAVNGVPAIGAKARQPGGRSANRRFQAQWRAGPNAADATQRGRTSRRFESAQFLFLLDQI